MRGEKQTGPRLWVRPVTYRQACAYIELLHRHHDAPRGQKFAICVVDDLGAVRGVATVGRPVARAFDDGLTAEVNRSCTDGCENANSALYGAARRICRELGYNRVITYTQEGESGISLRAAGWVMVKELEARGSWAESSPKYAHLRDAVGSGGVGRILWETRFTGAEAGPAAKFDAAEGKEPGATLFDGAE